MGDVDLFNGCTLSERTLEKLKNIKEALNEDIAQADPMWQIIIGKKEEEQVDADSEESTEDVEGGDDNSSLEVLNRTHLPSTQFYFTQVEKDVERDIEQTANKKRADVLESLCEGLERTNGKLEFGQLESLSDEEVLEVICDLEKKLSVTGIYNLCCSMNNMSLEHGIRYTAIFYSHLLLPKIIALEEPSRLFSSAIVECVQKSPDDVQKLIFIPLLNIDLKDTTIANAIVNAFGSQRNAILITEFLTSVKELKLWHIPILQNLLSIKTDQSTNDKLIRLFLDKALHFSKDKNFGKLILSFIKKNVSFSEEQKSSLWEIVVTNETLFKKPMENILKNM